MSLTPEQIASMLGAVTTLLTVLLGLGSMWVTLRLSRKTSYNEHVTKARSIWIENMKMYFSEYFSIAVRFFEDTGNVSLDRNADLNRLEYLRQILILNLNPNDRFDQSLKNHIDSLNFVLKQSDSNISRSTEIASTYDSLFRLVHAMFRFEWIGYKFESRKGEMSPKVKANLKVQEFSRFFEHFSEYLNDEEFKYVTRKDHRRLEENRNIQSKSIERNGTSITQDETNT